MSGAGRERGLALSRRWSGDPEAMAPPDWRIDWEDAPFPYKTWVGVERLGLARAPRLGRLLQRTYGLMCARWTPAGLGPGASPRRTLPVNPHATWQLRRPVGSGGGLYPVELYVYARACPGIARGIYHYDVAHHALVPLRDGDHDDGLAAACGGQLALGGSELVLLASVMFWKNRFKYADFGYRLSAVDSGVVLGQILDVAAEDGFDGALQLRFVDDQLAQLVGIDGVEESVYAIVPLTLRTMAAPSPSPPVGPFPALRRLDARHLERSAHVKRTADAAEMHQRSRIGSADELAAPLLPPIPLPDPAADDVRLPAAALPPSGWLDTALPRRTSSGERFCPGSMSQRQLSMLLRFATRPLAADVLAPGDGPLARVRVYATVLAVDGVPVGAYAYDRDEHRLLSTRRGRFGLTLQGGLLAGNINLDVAAACLHVVGAADHGVEWQGDRGYRIQQMLAGVMVQRLQLAAAAIGVGSHPLLGFDVHGVDELYRLDDRGQTTLAAIAVGQVHPGLFLESAISI